MIFGIGVDIVDLKRFAQASITPNFRNKYFSENESILPIQSLAGHFAAREALYKALQNQQLFDWKDIEVVSEIGGKPKFIFYNALADFCSTKKIFLTITHVPEFAISVVVIED
jgi:holo-[acyl-carrier protein] synthase